MTGNDLLEKVWPIFAPETRDGLHELAEGVMELETAAPLELVTALRRTAHTIKGSAASLGLTDIERTAHAVEDVLALADGGRALSPGAVEAVLRAIAAVGDSLGAAERGHVEAVDELIRTLGGFGPAQEPPVGSPQPSAHHPVTEAPSDLEALTDEIGALCGTDGAERAAHADRAREIGARLAKALPGGSGEAARRIAEAMEKIGGGGLDEARAIAAAAAEVVALRSGAAAGPTQAVEGVQRAPAPPRAEDGSVRVESSRLDAVAADVDQMIVGVSGRGRRARDLERMEQELRDAMQQLRTGLAEARIRDDARPRALSGALERLRSLEAEVGTQAREMRRESEREGLIAHGLRDLLKDLRMVPAQIALASLRPAVREGAAKLGKKVRLRVTGGDVRLDRRVLDELRGPLLHLVRNGLDHGIEAPEVRAAAGKVEEATLEVHVEPRGDRVLFTVRDDGAGLSPERLRAVAVQRGLMTAVEAGRLTDAEAARIAFRPGVSTAAEITALSGRGVGLDVVADAVRRLGGTVDVAFERGRGTTFSLEAPLAMSGTAGLLFKAAGGTALLPLESVQSVVIVRPGEVGTIAGRQVITVEGVQVPYASLAQALSSGAGPSPAETAVALVVAAGGKRAALAVDEILGEHPMVVSSLGRRLVGVRRLAGAAVLDDGRVVSVLQPGELIGVQRVREEAKAAPRLRIVVADDSLSTRAAAKSILEIAGYTVLPAADGQEAFDLAREKGCDLVVSDVQMPRMDGLELTRRLKGHPALASVPVILVTSLDGPEDRAAGLRAGADGYLVKREVARGALLELVRRLLPE